MTQVCLVLILGVRGLPVSSVGPSKTSWGDKEWGFLSSNNEAVALVPFFRGQVGHPPVCKEVSSSLAGPDGRQLILFFHQSA